MTMRYSEPFPCWDWSDFLVSDDICRIISIRIQDIAVLYFDYLNQSAYFYFTFFHALLTINCTTSHFTGVQSPPNVCDVCL